MRDRVAAAFSDLSGDQREALRLRVIDELSYAEVAEKAGVGLYVTRSETNQGKILKFSLAGLLREGTGVPHALGRGRPLTRAGRLWEAGPCFRDSPSPSSPH